MLNVQSFSESLLVFGNQKIIRLQIQFLFVILISYYRFHELEGSHVISCVLMQYRFVLHVPRDSSPILPAFAATRFQNGASLTWVEQSVISL